MDLLHLNMLEWSRFLCMVSVPTFGIQSTLDSQRNQRMDSDSVWCMFICSSGEFRQDSLWVRTQLMHASDISNLSDRQHCLVILNDSLFTSHSLSKRQCDPCYVHVIIPSICRSLCRLPSDYPDVVVNGTSQPSVTMTTASVSRKTKNISFSAIFNLSFLDIYDYLSKIFNSKYQ